MEGFAPSYLPGSKKRYPWCWVLCKPTNACRENNPKMVTCRNLNWRLKLAQSLAVGGAIAGMAGISDSLWDNCASRAVAQITPDRTLGNQPSVLTPNVQIGNSTGDRIDGGVQQGANLFHSFLEFNVNQGQRVYFANPARIENIFSRVTGTNPSKILGTLGVNGQANLFLLNPNGIIFGPNARLDVRGSFVGTTANGIEFGDRGFFSASTPNNPSNLLTVNPSAFLFNQIAAQPIHAIEVNGATLAVPDGRSLLLLGGNISPTTNSTGGILINGGQLSASGGRIELGGLAGLGTVGLNIDGNNLRLNFPNGVARTDISLTNKAEVAVAASGGGSIAFNARNIDILEGSVLRAGIKPLSGSTSAQAGDITLKATETINIQNSFIYNAAFDAGNGGNLSIDTGKLIIKDGVVATATFSQGRAGDLTVNASESVDLTNTSANGSGSLNIPVRRSLNVPIRVPIGLFAASLSLDNLIGLTNIPADLIANFLPQSGGNAGNLTINTGRLLVQGGATVSAATTSQGRGGNLTINASDSIQVSGTAANGLPSGVQNGTRGRGSGGDLIITTRQLIIQNGGWVTTGTVGDQPGGILTVNASDLVELTGTSSDGVPSNLTSGTQGAGNSQDLTINTRRLVVQDGAVVTAGTSDRGRGGTLTVNASDSVELIGTAAVAANLSTFVSLIGDSGASLFGVVDGRLFPSGLITGTAGAGDAGSLTITTGRLVIRDGAQASVSTTSAGDAGRLTVRASEVELSGTSEDGKFPNAVIGPSLLTTAVSLGATGNGGELSIETGRLIVQDRAEVAVSNLGSGRAGNLDIQSDSIQLDNQGKLTAETTSGNGGNITLQAQDILLMRHNSQISTNAGTAQAGGDGGNIAIATPFIVAVPSENSDISANAYTGNGGTIAIKTQGIFGIEFRDRPTPLSDITASSEYGVNGVVDINRPDVDPSQGLINLPTEVVDPTSLVDNRCQIANRSTQSEFIITGRGGLPPNPNETLEEEGLLEDLGTSPVVETGAQWRRHTTKLASPSSPPDQIVEAQGWIIGSDGNVILTAQAPTATPKHPWQTPASCHKR
ncbi:MAG TPA: hypothetical protein DCP31_24620 [Cyanobacteria bacterium UBA8543]|nr:hypothetical protein [Cyanobacteria bacterium UBA8543]